MNIRVYLRSILCVLAIVLVFLFPVRAHAQLSDADLSAGLESCFLYYDYGKVSVNLSMDKGSYMPGDTGNIVGTIVNNNKFPLTNVMLYAQLYRVNTEGNVNQDGHFLVDRFPLQQGINMVPGETKHITSSLAISPQYADGSYRLTYYITSQEGFHYAGRPFLEEDFAGTSLFDITGGVPISIQIDQEKLIVNGTAHHIRDPIVQYPFAPMKFSVPLLDYRDIKSDLVARVKWYAFEDTFEQNIVSQRTEVIPAGANITTSFTPPTSGAYVMVIEITDPQKTVMKYRFAILGSASSQSSPLRVNDMGVTSYPASTGSRAYVCIHSPAPEQTSVTRVTFQVLDATGKVAGEKTISQAFSGSIRAISLPLETLSSIDQFTLRTTWSWTDQKGQTQTKTLEKIYSCDTFSGSNTSIQPSYDSASQSIDLSSRTVCGKAATTATYLDQVRVTDSQGNIALELYNHDSQDGKISIDSLPPGNYTAELIGPDGKKDMKFAVAGSTLRKKHVPGIWVTLSIIAILALSMGYIWHRKKHKKA